MRNPDCFYTNEELENIRKALVDADLNQDGIINFYSGDEEDSFFINVIEQLETILKNVKAYDAEGHIFEGLLGEEADTNNDGEVTINELMVYLERIENW